MQLRREHCILKLSSFLDKHYISSKKLSPNSVFLFLVPTQDPHDTVLIKAEPSKKRFIVYDPKLGRKAKTFTKEVETLRPFLVDYFDNFKPNKFSV